MYNSNLISIIIPCRNEEGFIGKCLDSIIANDYPEDILEVLVVDGISEDGTRDFVERYAHQHHFIRLLDNPKKITPVALNIGIKHAKGNVIIRMDAHNIYPSDYISKCIDHLDKLDADNVGGVWITLPGSNTFIANSIAFVMSHPFGVGGAKFRTGIEKPTLVDTVPFGCYRREVFDNIGLFDEIFLRNQDDELNYRLTKSGGKIYLVPEIISYYHARPTLSKLWGQYFQYGYWKVRVIQKHKLPASWRHLVPIALVLSLITGTTFALFSIVGLYFLILVAGSYLLLTAFFSAQISTKKGWKYLFVLPLAFGAIHFSYGLGFLKGIFDFILLKKHLKKKIEDEALTR